MNEAPYIFQPIFGNDWERMPPVMRAHYGVRSASDDTVVVKGWLDVRMSWPVRIASRLLGVLVPYNGNKVPVQVTFTGDAAGQFYFDRAFDFGARGVCHFRSVLQPVGGDEVMEWMGYGVGWRCAYQWNGERVILKHRGYVLRVFGRCVPLPLELLLGKGYAEETPISDTCFAMWTHTKHPLFGEMFRYAGEFEVKK
ncbi:MAG: hypothetical protein CMM94_06585 [Rickettsiales bacterium]|nr:hypothetical protein [Rickettsiales bacterium]